MAHFPHFETTTEANRTSRVTFRGREGVFLACSLASAEVERDADVESRRVYDYNFRATARRVVKHAPSCASFVHGHASRHLTPEIGSIAHVARGA